MTDPQLSHLFAEGTAPERDPAFAHSVAAGIGRARLGMRLRALALRASGVLALSGATFVAAGVIKPVLVQLVDGWSQFMGVPVPVVLGALTAGLALSAGRYVLSR
jgi:hypothetical protein